MGVGLLDGTEKLIVLVSQNGPALVQVRPLVKGVNLACQRDLGDHGADEDVRAVFAAAARVKDGGDLTGGEHALVDAELIQAAGVTGAAGGPGGWKPR